MDTLEKKLYYDCLAQPINAMHNGLLPLLKSKFTKWLSYSGCDFDLSFVDRMQNLSFMLGRNSSMI